MPDAPQPRFQMSLGVLMLGIAVASAYCWNLKIVAVDCRDDVIGLWNQITGRPPGPYRLPPDWWNLERDRR